MLSKEHIRNVKKIEFVYAYAQLLTFELLFILQMSPVYTYEIKTVR